MSQLHLTRASLSRFLPGQRGFHTTSTQFWWKYPGWWFEDYKARRWPRTEEERKAAAAKYGLREGDYKPLKEDYMGGVGDYPDVGEINYGVKDPYENWTWEKYRRNYGEQVHIDFNMYLPDRTTFTRTETEQGWKLVRTWFLYYFVFFSLIIIAADFPVRIILPIKPKQYPYDYNYALPNFNPKLFPLTHYTFEPAPQGPKIEMGKEEKEHDH